METNNTGNSTKFIIVAVVVLAIVGIYAFVGMNKNEQMKADEIAAMKRDAERMENDKKSMNTSMMLKFAPQSGFPGSVETVITPNGEKTEVVITMTGGPAGGNHPAHIHLGACPTPGAVKYPLSPVVNGRSVTMIDAPIEQIWSMLPLAVNVHKSAAEAKVYLACADIKNAAEARMTPNPMRAGAMMNKDTSMGGAMMKDTSSGSAMMKVGSYEAYAPEKIAQAGVSGNVVLFFHANWCPTCRAFDADTKANAGKIPGNLTILDVDYDKSADLKKKYGVTYQHTFVQVDKNGTMIKKWMGSSTLAEFLKEVK